MGANGRRRSKSPTRARPDPVPNRTSRLPSPPRSAAVLDGEFITEEFALLDNPYQNPEPRSFPLNVKQQCWNKAEKIRGRDPERWRLDPLGNKVFRKLVGCPGCLCHDYDHIIPYSKGGKSTLDNCQVLQATVNRSKGNRTELSRSELIRRSSYCRVQDRDMDLLELSAYGNVRRVQESGWCNIQ